MQREIKFRGISKDEHPWSIERKGQFIYGNLASYYDGTYGIFDRDEEWHYDVIPETVGQYTGLKDKNGKEIYEGDIVRADDGEVFIVKYGEHATSEWNDNYELGFYVESTSEEEISKAIRTDIIFWVKHRALEIIGNIHDNPELLQEDTK